MLEEVNAKSLERLKARSRSRQLRLAQQEKSEKAKSTIARVPAAELRKQSAYRSFVGPSIKQEPSRESISDTLSPSSRPSVRDVIDLMRQSAKTMNRLPLSGA